MKSVKIGSKFVGDDHPCLLSFEAGATHTGLSSALELVDAAGKAGADAMKFQTILVDELMSPAADTLMIGYETPEGKRKETIRGALERRELQFDDWKKIREKCSEYGMGFISTPSGKQTVDWLVELKADAIKVAKSDINNFYLVDYMARTGLPIILDAREKFQDVDRCLRICEEHNNENVIIMHCPSGYPAEHAGVHLKVIPFIKDNFNVPVAYSDHSVGSNMCYAAIGLGVNLIEKTITKDKATDGVEHFMSLEPNEISDFIKNIRDVEAALGDTRIVFNSRVKSETRRSIFVDKPIKAGEQLKLENLSFKRPGTGISVDEYEEVLGKKAKRDLDINKMLNRDDFE